LDTKADESPNKTAINSSIHPIETAVANPEEELKKEELLSTKSKINSSELKAQQSEAIKMPEAAGEEKAKTTPK